MTTKKKKEDMISLDNWRILMNIPLGKFMGFKTTLTRNEYPVDELDKKYAAYLKRPAFKEE